ncbi:Membrane protein involved in the export of O-antigen and teichoic acid [Halovenus aranensis]|uniref:Membrane protein involved in the export of O-antigen and teichoic acid n=1 Tax=Halovenus aranensis TaxID=890420 RepID=A0A1G8ZN23_9EURY|nr:flippase [Halovenus aranensis]SDK16451.1 Membrane protein involved in the export of O-antigen and teichoic acid [Halovenus aranensis]
MAGEVKNEEIKDDLSSAIESAIFVFIGILISSFSGLAERITIARFLDPGLYGDVNIALAILNLSSMIALFGLAQGVPRYMSRYDKIEDMRGVWFTGLVFSLLISGVVMMLFLHDIELFTSNLMDTENAKGLLGLFLLSLPFFVGMRIGIGGIRGFENTVYRTYVKDIIYPIGRIILLMFFLFLGMNILAVGYAYLIACILGFIFAHILLNRLMPLYGDVNYESVELIKFSLPLVFASLLFQLLVKTDTIMLGYFVDSYEVGLYSAAYPISNMMILILSAFGFIFLPMTSRLDSEDKTENIDSIYKMTTKWIVVFTFPLFVTIITVPGQILHLLFGSNFTAASTALIIITVGFFARAIGGRNHEVLAAIGLQKYVLYSSFVAFIVNILLNIILIPQLGIEGAAFASGTSFVLLNFVMVAVLSIKKGIYPVSQTMKRTIITLTVLVLIPVFAFTHLFTMKIFAPLYIGIISSVLTVAVVVLFNCLEENDIILVEVFESKTGLKIPFIRSFIP